MQPANSFGTAFEGARSNFDMLRLMAALAVLFGHSFVLTAGAQSFETMDPLSQLFSPYAAYGEAIQEFAVDLFFVISGFLVTCSYLRSRSLLRYALSRVLRIYPAAILGALVTHGTLGLALSRRLSLINLKPLGDLSYGVYLYAFPVQQALIHLFPNQFGAWSLVERHALSLKKRLLGRLS